MKLFVAAKRDKIASETGLLKDISPTLRISLLDVTSSVLAMVNLSL
jgi:hypothetical protein